MPDDATLRVRRFEERDRDALRDVYLASRRATFTWLDVSRFRAEDFDTSTEGETIWVAERGDAVVGFASVWEADTYLHNLFVHPDHVRTGVGAALLDACLAAMGRPVTLKCLVHNEAALSFYARRGFVVASEATGPDGPYRLLALKE
jgi:ribosomal protein S18 acetylase RimI-like enzyme